jgi:rhodanese-related sulfurtransferase
MISALKVEDLKQFQSRFQLIDVRSPSEFAAGHIPGTANVPLEQITQRVEDLESASPVVLVCKSGTRARMAASLASRFDVLSVLEGGTDAWVRQGLPVVRSQNSSWSLERQVRLGAGVIVLTGLGLGLLVNTAWLGLTAFAGAGLAFAGATDMCAMGMLLSRMPWNRS